jgi:hypothetical protein
MSIYNDYDLAVPYNGDRATYQAFVEALKLKIAESNLSTILNEREDAIVPPKEITNISRKLKHAYR